VCRAPYNAGFPAGRNAAEYHVNRVPRGVFFFLFTVSGFAGLIYESIWTHYLKLFLGHAAYAQTLVLALFMGGMAIGSWLCSRRSARWKNLLRGYALAEGMTGLLALAFHPVFVASTDAAYESILPALGGDVPAMLFKWTLAGLMILPQSVLLGMTFPLMSAGLIRRYPAAPGESLAMLYFTNSLGAAVGVLASGFFMIEALGLPGTVQAAGILNLGLAALVWLLARGDEPRVAGRSEAGAAASPAPYGLFLGVALLTGAASFIYEIGWIRMLSLVLGSSTHSFELMLSAFILGLACGGYWVRRRIDSIGDPVRFLGIVQVAMGLLALATLPLYGQMFGLMRAVMNGLAKTDAGYTLFLLSSHGIALAIMFPATFCAGMTLPLLTFTLLGHGEKGSARSTRRTRSARSWGCSSPRTSACRCSG
jgi:predicted membrane-bound spermidine synthase